MTPNLKHTKLILLAIILISMETYGQIYNLNMPFLHTPHSQITLTEQNAEGDTISTDTFNYDFRGIISEHISNSIQNDVSLTTHKQYIPLFQVDIGHVKYNNTNKQEDIICRTISTNEYRILLEQILNSDTNNAEKLQVIQGLILDEKQKQALNIFNKKMNISDLYISDYRGYMVPKRIKKHDNYSHYNKEYDWLDVVKLYANYIPSSDFHNKLSYFGELLIFCKTDVYDSGTLIKTTLSLENYRQSINLNNYQTIEKRTIQTNIYPVKFLTSENMFKTFIFKSSTNCNTSFDSIVWKSKTDLIHFDTENHNSKQYNLEKWKSLIDIHDTTENIRISDFFTPINNLNTNNTSFSFSHSAHWFNKNQTFKYDSLNTTIKFRKKRNKYTFTKNKGNVITFKTDNKSIDINNYIINPIQLFTNDTP